jgi:hypothetical protein
MARFAANSTHGILNSLDLAQSIANAAFWQQIVLAKLKV